MDDCSSSARSAPAESADGRGLIGDRGPGRSDETGLTPRDRAILDLEGRLGQQSGLKEETVRRELGLSAARYYQLLNALIDRPEALIHDPMLIRRLQRIRDARADARRGGVVPTASGPSAAHRNLLRRRASAVD